jgi:hypothetical protein
MKTLSFRSGALIAVACGSLFAAACKKDEKKEAQPPPAPAPEAKDTAQPAADKVTPDPAKPAGEKTAAVHCQGVNACKGQGGCKTAANSCKGQNGCKGKGFVDVASEEECKTKGGTVMAAMPM